MRSPHLIRAIGMLVLLAAVLSGSALAQESLPRPAAGETAAAGPLHPEEYPQANMPLWHNEVVASVGNVGIWPSLALHPTTGEPGIAYGDATNNILTYARRVCDPSCNWGKEVLDAENGQVPSMAYDASGNPHVSYYRGGFRYAYRNPILGWGHELIYSIYSDRPETSLVIDSQGRPHVAALSTVDFLYHFYDDGAAWQMDEIVYGFYGDDGFPSLVLGELEHPYISFRYYGDLTVVHYDGTDWQYETAPEGNVYHTSMGMDSSGHLHIAYYDGTEHTLEYTHFDGATWTIETVDTVGYWAYLTGTCSLEVRPAGTVFISYYDAINDDLKFATKVGSTWDIEVVDSEGNVGEYNSLVVDDHNRPYIAYYDTTNGDLKFAYLTYGAFLPAVYREEAAGNRGRGSSAHY